MALSQKLAYSRYLGIAAGFGSFPQREHFPLSSLLVGRSGEDTWALAWGHAGSGRAVGVKLCSCSPIAFWKQLDLPQCLNAFGFSVLCDPRRGFPVLSTAVRDGRLASPLPSGLINSVPAVQGPLWLGLCGLPVLPLVPSPSLPHHSTAVQIPSPAFVPSSVLGTLCSLCLEPLSFPFLYLMSVRN